uniref:TEA domain-containing protein n=1 Tax=Schizophyllum commune (strain H4-8 / FGSC 9210) TaxID=578458 RepID=D8QCR7_SCHCM
MDRALLEPPMSESSSSSSSAGVSPSPPPDSENKEVFESIYKGRKSWKTTKNGEMVWPPNLEAALIEGLELYVPDDSRETRLLGRFPMRNRFISDHIFKKTGQRRTPKQVGSRLQQLRDTCAGKKLQGLLAPCKPPPRPRPRTRAVDSFYTNGFRSDSGSPPCSDASSPPVTPTDGAFADHQRLGGAAPVIYIDVLPKGSFSPYDVAGGGAPPPCNCCSTSPCTNTFGPRHSPRPIQWIDPTITFVSPRIIGHVLTSPDTAAESRYIVRHHGRTIFVESASLTLKDLPEDQNDSGGFLYSTPFVPGFWSTIVQAPDPREYSVTHQVLEDVDDDGALPLLFHSMYRFRYPIEEHLAGAYSQQESWSAPKPTMEDMNPHIDPSAMLPMDSAPTSTFFTGLNPYSNAVGGEAYSWSSHPSSAPEVPMFYAGGGGFDMQASATAHLNDPSRYSSDDATGHIAPVLSDLIWYHSGEWPILFPALCELAFPA